MRLNNSWKLSVLILVSLMTLPILQASLAIAAPANFANADFNRVWNRTDQQVSDGRISRTYLWGPEPFTAGLQESYAESPSGSRQVQYFDKSRMEVTNPNGDKNSQYYVTNGLIARELMTGQMQMGDNKFENRGPALIGVAGDSDDKTGPTYKALARVSIPAATDDVGIPVNGFLDRDGNTNFDREDFYKKWRVSYAYFEPTTQHNIAGPFWSFLNQTGSVLDTQGKQVNGRLFDPVFYATGLPITEAYWANVKVAGKVKDVLIQAFERRVLTFTPENDPAYQVEMGNIGRHYYEWRYNNTQTTPQPNPTTPPTNPTTPTPAPTMGSSSVPSINCLPAATGSEIVQACVDSNTRGTNATAYGRLIVAGRLAEGAKMLTTWNYSTKQVTCNDGVINGKGVASCIPEVVNDVLGFTVTVDVTFQYNGQTYTTTTSFVK